MSAKKNNNKKTANDNTDNRPFHVLVRDFIKKHANCTLPDIADHFGIDPVDTDKDFLKLKETVSSLAARDKLVARERENRTEYYVEQSIGTCVVRYRETQDGYSYLQPVTWPDDRQKRPKQISIAAFSKGVSNAESGRVKDGELLVARIRNSQKGADRPFEARVLDRLDHEITGTIGKNHRGEWNVSPLNRHKNYYVPIPSWSAYGFEEGDVVLYRLTQPSGQSAMPMPVIVENFGKSEDPQTIGRSVAAEFGLSQNFNSKVMDELANLKDPDWTTANRTDLRDIPFVTIDDITTTDMDDAMYAAPVMENGVQKGWHMIVAIADVAQYIKPGSAMDKEAEHRGNTNYLPGHRCDMIPTELAADKCSLVPHEDRSCLAMHMWIDMNGNMVDKKLQRGIMNSRAKLHHKQVEAAMRGDIDDTIAPHMGLIQNLYKAWHPMAKASAKRGKLSIDSSEQKIEFDADGNFVDISRRPYMDINRVIEEFMVLANVAAAEILIEKRVPGVYRLHESPSEYGIEKWSPQISSLEYHINPQKDIRQQMNHVLKDSSQRGEADIVHPLLVRMQQRAVYGTDTETGHFALALAKYAHFTSPIRRYADLIVHRALITACGLGDDGAPKNTSVGALQGIADHISNRENLAKQAEREARKRYETHWANTQIIEHLSNSVDSDKKPEAFKATIVEIEQNGIIVELKKNGVRGFIPVEYLPGAASYHFNDQYKALLSRVAHDDNAHNDDKGYTDYMYQRGGNLDVVIANVDIRTSQIRFKPRFPVGAFISRFESTLIKELDKNNGMRIDHGYQRGKKRKQRHRDRAPV